MALTNLVDTSVLARISRPLIRQAIEHRTERGELARAGISDLELGFSARNAREWDRIAEALKAFALIETTTEHMRRARHIQRLLAAKHQRVRKVPDLLIAAAAEAENLIVLHYDADFDQIAVVTAQKTEWVLPAGSID